MSTSPKSRKKPSLIGQIIGASFLLGLLGYGVLMVSGAETRTRVVFSGPPIVDVISPLFEPMVPIWRDIEPGVRMELDPYDLVSRQLLLHGNWEHEIWEQMASNLPKDGVFVDVGAHIGYYTLKAAHKVGDKGTVISVEPNPETLKKLNANIDASKASGIVKVQPVAASDKEAQLEFFASPRANTGESSLSRKNAAQAGEGVNSYQVRARPLDDIIQEAGVQRLDVLKVDVEGADFMVLKGAERTLNRFHPKVYVETVNKQLKEMGSSVAELKAWMVAQGYKVNQLTPENAEFVPAH
jgi:FkbM family methyltransferase